MASWIRRLFDFAGVTRNHQTLPSLGANCKAKDVATTGRLPQVTTGGLQVVAMDRSRLLATNDQIVLVQASGREVTARCGHRAHELLVFDVYGDKVSGDGNQSCPTCSVEELGRITVRCAICGLPILPGDAVAVYECGGADIRDDIAPRVGESQVLGCTRWDCCLPGAYAGHWDGAERGFISAFN